MFLILAIAAAALTAAWWFLVVFANSMSDASSVQDISPWPGVAIGVLIVGVLLVIHFVGV
jgi:hypothetical protein